MWSSLGLIAYALHREEVHSDTDVRVERARAHTQALHPSPLHELRLGDRRGGLLAWHGEGDERTGAPEESSRPHRALVRAAMPDWADIPYYAPTFATRTSVPIWEMGEWPVIVKYVVARVDDVGGFDASRLDQVLTAIADCAVSKEHPAGLHRLMWELTFRAYLGDLSRSLEAVREDISSCGRAVIMRLRSERSESSEGGVGSESSWRCMVTQ